MDYKERAANVRRAIEHPLRVGVGSSVESILEAALRSAAADAYEDAAQEVECFNSKFAPAFVKDDKDCPPCDDCVVGARLRGKAASLRAGEGR